MKILVLSDKSDLFQAVEAEYCDSQLLRVSTLKQASAALNSSYFDRIIVACAQNQDVVQLQKFNIPISYFQAAKLSTNLVQVKEPGYTLLGSVLQSQAYEAAQKSIERNRDYTKLASKQAIIDQEILQIKHQFLVLEEKIEDKFEKIEVCLFGDASNPGAVDIIRELTNKLHLEELKVAKQHETITQWKIAWLGLTGMILAALIPFLPVLFNQKDAESEKSIPNSVQLSPKR